MSDGVYTVGLRLTMSVPAKTLSACELRVRISDLRRELTTTTEEYNVAKRSGGSERVILLLRKRSSLVRQLFELQSSLLVAYRMEANASAAPPA